MKVYIVTAGCYSDYRIEAVFTDEEQANLYCALHAGHHDSPEVEEYETDNWQAETGNDVKVRWIDTFHEKYVHLSPSANFVTKDENRISVIKQADNEWQKAQCGDFCEIVVTVDRTCTLNKVKKIMQDRIAAWKYERAMKEVDDDE